MAAAMSMAPEFADAHCAVFRLPPADWGRRVIGTFANALAQAHPERAHAVLVPGAAGYLTVSVRAPLQALHGGMTQGADALCRRFDTGGGRIGAAGIDRLPAARVDEFTDALRAMSWR
jgi:hypothetical protein